MLWGRFQGSHPPPWFSRSKPWEVRMVTIVSVSGSQEKGRQHHKAALMVTFAISYFWLNFVTWFSEDNLCCSMRRCKTRPYADLLCAWENVSFSVLSLNTVQVECKGEKSFGEEVTVFLVTSYTFRRSQESIFHTQTLENNKTFEVYFKPSGRHFFFPPLAIFRAAFSSNSTNILKLTDFFFFFFFFT